MYLLGCGLPLGPLDFRENPRRVSLRPIADITMALIIQRMDTVFILQHERPEAEDRIEDVRFIGAYSSEASAPAAVERLRTQPGFRDYPDHFTIDAYEIDKDHWTEGFIVG